MEIAKQAKANDGKWEWIAPSGLRFVGSACYRMREGKRETFLGCDTTKVNHSVRWSS